MRTSPWLAGLLLVITQAAAGQEKFTTDWGTFVFERDLGSMSGVVSGPADSVYRVLRVYIADLKLTMKDDDPVTRQFDVKRLRLVRRIGKRPISLYLSCGEGLTGPNADLWHVFLNLGAQVTPATKGARLQLLVNAEAVDVPGGRSERVPCTTTGRLEYEILTHLRQVFPGT